MFGGGIGTGEIIIILIVALLVFGPKKLPEMGKAIGSAVTQFKKGLAGQADEEKKTPPAQIKESSPVDSGKGPSEPAG